MVLVRSERSIGFVGGITLHLNLVSTELARWEFWKAHPFDQALHQLLLGAQDLDLVVLTELDKGVAAQTKQGA